MEKNNEPMTEEEFVELDRETSEKYNKIEDQHDDKQIDDLNELIKKKKIQNPAR